MTTGTSTTLGLVAAALLAVGAALTVTRFGAEQVGQPAKLANQVTQQWSASAPGRVEPRRGEVRLSAATAGRVSEISVAINERVTAGDLLVKLEDEDARARVAAADAEAAVRRRERDSETTNARLAIDRRQAEDTATASERALVNARAELDRLARVKRQDASAATDDAVAAARTTVNAALDKLDADRAALRRAQSAPGVPLPTRVEAGLTAARADLALAEAALERTRIRAPADGTVLQINARVGESAAPSPEQALIVLGDLTALRVRAELEERDVARVAVGQGVVVRSDAFPGREFSGKIATLARTLAPGRLAQRGPRRPTDLDTLEVMIDLDPAADLLPGMRVDVFFRMDGAPKAEAKPPVAATRADAPAAVPEKK